MTDLHNKEASIEFYDARYEQGYMEEWDEGKKYKVREILRSLGLPENGKALDFGCGNGVFTNIIKESFPNWDVYGVEISKTAVANARRKHPNCKFFLAEEAPEYVQKFDFLFSHHVIEHVPDLSETFQTINRYLKETAFQLHILPCGNAGSFEFNICQLQRNGIEREKGNRFFFEEPGHLRRLNTEQFAEWEKQIGFTLERDYYANQYHGAVNWITKSSPRFVKKLTATENAINEAAKRQLLQLRRKLLPLTYYQFPYSKYWTVKAKWRKTLGDYGKLAVLFVPGIVSKIVFERLEAASNREWNAHKTEKNGSEMFLFFKR